MKKEFMVGIALILALSLAGLTLAQEEVKKEKAQEQVSPKPHIWRMGGLVATVDPQAKTLSVHQETVHHDGVVNLRVSKKVAKELSNIKAGDLVNVWVNGEVITALNKVT
jgi:hypothetical protein